MRSDPILGFEPHNFKPSVGEEADVNDNHGERNQPPQDRPKY